MNGHITEFLDYYIGLESSPEYAVMIRGPWGSGKTFFINDYIDRRNEIDFLRLSLYGVSSIGEIRESLFQQLYPVLGSKAAKYAGNILKGLVKTTIKVDLDVLKDAGAEIEINPLKSELPKWLHGIEKKILVIDDLERCKLDLKTVLGYLNQFVENKGLKMVILANEREVLKSKLNVDCDYSLIKEKLIGKSFDVLSEPEIALDVFIKESTISHILTPNKDLLLEVYRSANYNNLRHLKQSIIDFQYFWQTLPIIKISSKPELERHILELFFCISVEIKNGKVDEKTITEFIEFNQFKEENDLTDIHKLNRKYVVLQHSSQPISKETLEEYFTYGKVDKIKVNQEILNSSYFEDENTPPWQKLNRFSELEDEEFEECYNKTIEDLNEFKFSSATDLIFITDYIVEITNSGLTDNRVNEVVNIAKNNILYLKKSSKLKEIDIESLEVHWNHVSDSFKNSVDGLEFYRFIKERVLEAHLEDYSNQAQQLLKCLPTNVGDFARKVLIVESPDNNYRQIPILSYVNVHQFVDKVLNIENKEIRRFSWFFEDRYKYNSSELLKECAWIEEVIEELRNKVPTNLILSPKNLQIHKTLIPRLEKIVKNLKEIKTSENEIEITP